MLLAIAYVMLGVATCIDGALLLFIFRKHALSPSRSAFMHMLLGTASWNLSLLLYLIFQLDILLACVYSAAIYFVAARYIFVRAYTNTANAPMVRYVTFASILMGIAAWVPNTLVRNPHVSKAGYVVVENGYLTTLFTLYIIYLTIHPIIVLYRFSRKNPEARPIFIGLTIYGGFVVLLSNLVLPVVFNIYYLNTIGPAFSTIFTAFVFYAIFRYQFLHIKILAQRSIIFSVLFGVILCVYGLVMSAVAYFFGVIEPVVQYIIGAYAIFIGVVYGQSLERWLRNITDSIFMQRTYVYKNAVRELTHIFAYHSTSRALLNASLGFLKRTLHVRRITFIPHTSSRRLSEDATVISIPIYSSHGTHGTLVVSHKRSSDPFTQTDRELLRFYATILGIGLDKAKLFENLENEVVARTREIAELRAAERTRYSALAHEIKTPLTVLAGTYELFQKARKVTSTDIDTFGKSIEKTKRAVHDMLEISRIATTKQTHHVILNLSALMIDIAEYVETICAVERIAFNATITPGCMIRGDARDLELLINNILSNAVRYTKSVPDPRIEVYLTKTDTHNTIEVIDNGIGIDPEDLAHIFEHGRRGRNTQDTDGDGIGLALAKEIADVHGATITVASELGYGTTVRIIFPQ